MSSITLVRVCLLLCLLTISSAQQTAPAPEIWDILDAGTAGAGSEVRQQLRDLMNNPEQRQMIETLFAHNMAQISAESESAFDAQEALRFLRSSTPNTKEKRKRSAPRSASSNGLLKYQSDMITSFLPDTGLANSNWNFEADECGSGSVRDVFNEMESARELSFGLQLTAQALRCICRVAPKCLFILPEILEIPIFWPCIPYIPLAIAATRIDYRYQRARFCADVRLEKLSNAVNLHTQNINGLLGELSRYGLEEGIFTKEYDPSFYETPANGGRLDQVNDLVTDIAMRRNLTLDIPGYTYNKDDLKDVGESLSELISNTSLVGEDRKQTLAYVYGTLLDIYSASISVTDLINLTIVSPAPTADDTWEHLDSEDLPDWFWPGSEEKI